MDEDPWNGHIILISIVDQSDSCQRLQKHFVSLAQNAGDNLVYVVPFQARSRQ